MDETSKVAKATKAALKYDPFIVMIKPVGSLCNMNCSYCYYKTNRNSDKIMSDETLELFIRQYIDATTGPVVNFIWHGGEPTLAGLDFFKRVVELQTKYLPDGWSCWNNLQTNGLLVDDEWCDFLAENNFDIGLSIDGTTESHNSIRKTNTDEITYYRITEAIKRLKEKGINPDLLCTVNSLTVKQPIEVYKALRGFSTGWIQFIPIVNKLYDGITPESITAAEYGKFLKDVFDSWVLYDLDTVGIQFFSEILRIASGGSASVCHMAPTCGRAVVVEADGRVYSCDHYADELHLLGDIHDKELLGLVNQTKQYEFGDKKKMTLTKKCIDCRWISFCNGGCPKDRIFTVPSEIYPLNHLCEGYMDFFSYIEPVIKLIINLQKQNRSATDIMKVLQNEVKRIWKDVKRNDPCPCGSGKKAKNCCWYKRM